MGEPVFENTPSESLHETLRRARQVSPTAIESTSGAVVVLRYEEVERLAHDQRAAGVGLSFFDFMGIPDGELRRWYGSLMFTNEGPTHHRHRRLVQRAFTPRAVERHRSLAAELTADRFATVAADGHGDLVGAFGDVPIAVICRLLGVPDEEVPHFLAYGDALSPVFGFMDPDQIVTASNAIGSLMADVDRMIGERPVHGDDLIDALLAAEDGDDRLTHEEVITIVGNLIVGGHDTTASQAGCTLLTLMRNPAVVDQLVTGGVTVTDVVNETIRYESSIGLIPRTLLEPVEVGGVELPAGSMVFLATSSANRETEVWGDPETVRPGRFAEPNAPRLLSFGSGAHYCLGAALARMTLEEISAGYAATATTLAPAFDLDDVEWRSVLGRSPVSLPVTATG